MRDQAKGFPDDRVCCGSCGRRMVPWMVTYQGEILRTVCPFCTETHQDFTPEFPSGLSGYPSSASCSTDSVHSLASNPNGVRQ